MNGHTAHFSLFAYGCLAEEREWGGVKGGRLFSDSARSYCTSLPSCEAPLLFIMELLHTIQVEG